MRQYDGMRGRTYLGRFRDAVSEDLQEICKQACRTLKAQTGNAYPLGQRHHDLMLLDVYRIDVDTGVAGRACGWENWIEIHTALMSADTDKMREGRDQVILHEIAHILDWWFFEGRHHGKSWRQCNVALGRPDEARCHSLGDLKGTKKLRRIPNKFAHYDCRCGAQWKRKVNFNEYHGRSALRVEAHQDCPLNGRYQFTHQSIEDVEL